MSMCNHVLEEAWTPVVPQFSTRYSSQESLYGDFSRFYQELLTRSTSARLNERTWYKNCMHSQHAELNLRSIHSHIHFGSNDCFISGLWSALGTKWEEQRHYFKMPPSKFSPMWVLASYLMNLSPKSRLPIFVVSVYHFWCTNIQSLV